MSKLEPVALDDTTDINGPVVNASKQMLTRHSAGNGGGGRGRDGGDWERLDSANEPGTSARVFVEVKFDGLVVSTFRFNGPRYDQPGAKDNQMEAIEKPVDGPAVLDASKVTDSGFGGGVDAGALLVLDIGRGNRAKTKIEMTVYDDASDTAKGANGAFGCLLGKVVLPWESLKWLCSSAPDCDYDVRPTDEKLTCATAFVKPPSEFEVFR